MLIIITKSLFLKDYSIILANYNYLRAREIEDKRVEQRAVGSGGPVKNGVLAHTNHKQTAVRAKRIRPKRTISSWPKVARMRHL